MVYQINYIEFFYDIQLHIHLLGSLSLFTIFS